MTEPSNTIQWTENDTAHSARWRSETVSAPPKRVVVVDDRITADDAYGLACQGTGLLWRGDFQNARQLLIAMAKRFDRQSRKAKPAATSKPGDAFNLHRQAQSQRTRTLRMLLVPIDADYGVPLRRAPDIRIACAEAWGPGHEESVVPLREVLGLIGAHEWRSKGIEIPAIGQRIHPHYGVFAPLRRDYIDLLAKAPLPPALSANSVAFDIGTGTGVLAAVLAQRGIERIVATDQDPRALACARENIAHLGLSERVDVIQADLYPDGRAALIVCNPPWLPARPSSPMEHAIYDPDSRMLRGFLGGLSKHLDAGGEGWLIVSDLSEYLGLRTREELLAAFDTAGLTVAGRLDTRPQHPKAANPDDPLHAARAAEVVSLWRLVSR